MAETIKCSCSNCGAKYRLPVEYQGRTAKCKKCGTKFKIPAEKSLEDSVLDWLKEAEEEADQEERVDQPRVVNMSDSTTATGKSKSRGGVIRIKSEGSDSS